MAYWLWSVPPDAFPAMLRAGTLALAQQGRSRLAEVRSGDQLFVYLSGRRVLAGQVEAVGEAFTDTTALVPGRHLPHRLRVLPRVVLPDEARVPFDGFAPHLRVLDQYAHLPAERRFAAVTQRVLHPLPALDGKVLEFVLRAREGASPEALMAAVEAVRAAARRQDTGVVAEAQTRYDASPAHADLRAPAGAPEAFTPSEAMETLLRTLEAQGFIYEPWHVAAYTVALRTKPFVLLAGATGVGKSRLPVLVATATGGVATVVPVRPDWTDPAEALGYTDLAGRFRPGAVLRAARTAADDPQHRFHTLVLDEATLGRPEHYLADVLSRIEARAPDGRGGWASPPLLTERVGDPAWQATALPASLGIVGTLNVDESGYALSRKVLDRAFVLELAAPALDAWPEIPPAAPPPARWPLAAWTPRALRLADLTALAPDEREAVAEAVAAVTVADRWLAPAGMAVGYRTRDEVALFVLHARDAGASFRRRDGTPVAPLDAALVTKLVPRLDSVRPGARAAVGALLAWAVGDDGADARRLTERWTDAGRPDTFGTRFPLMGARLARIVDGAWDDGVVSFWS